LVGLNNMLSTPPCLSIPRYHYWRSTTNNWTRTPLLNLSITPTVIGKRGKLAAIGSNLLAILPDNSPNSTKLQLLSSTAQGHFRDWDIIWEGNGNGWEPLLDRQRVADGVLSLLVVNGTNVDVVDFEIEGQ